MREVKFRAWVKELGILANVIAIDFENEKVVLSIGVESTCWWYASTFDLKDVELMQYTGLKDINGVEIYDGDILTDFGDAGPLYVEFSTEHAGFVFMDKFDNGPPSYTPKEISYEYFEIIGNLYKNPELLVNEGGA